MANKSGADGSIGTASGDGEQIPELTEAQEQPPAMANKSGADGSIGTASGDDN